MRESKAQQLATLVKNDGLVEGTVTAIWLSFGMCVTSCCHTLSPQAASGVNAAIFVMLQDWTSAGNNANGPDETTAKLGYTPSLPTNVRLDRLLKERFGLKRSETYATNLFLFIKLGGISAKIPRTHLLKAAEDFGWPQITAVRPKLVIALGLKTFDALRRAAKQLRTGRLRSAIDSPLDHHGIRIWCQVHTGSRGTVNAGGNLAVAANWKAMASWFRRYA